MSRDPRGDEYVRQEKMVRPLKEINKYLKTLNLSSVNEKMEERDAYPVATPKKRVRQFPQLCFGKP